MPSPFKQHSSGSGARCPAWSASGWPLVVSLFLGCGAHQQEVRGPTLLALAPATTDVAETACGVEPKRAFAFSLFPVDAAALTLTFGGPDGRARAACALKAVSQPRSEAGRSLADVGGRVAPIDVSGLPGILISAAASDAHTLLAEARRALTAPTECSAIGTRRWIDLLDESEWTPGPIMITAAGPAGFIEGARALTSPVPERADSGQTTRPPPQVRVVREGASGARLLLRYALEDDGGLHRAVDLLGAADGRLRRALLAAGLEPTEVFGEVRRRSVGPMAIFGAGVPEAQVDLAFRVMVETIQSNDRLPPTPAERARLDALVEARESQYSDGPEARALGLADTWLRYGEACAQAPPTDAGLSRRLKGGLAPVVFDSSALRAVVALSAEHPESGELDEGVWAEALAEAAQQAGRSLGGLMEIRPQVFAAGISDASAWPRLTVMVRPGTDPGRQASGSRSRVALHVRVMGGASVEEGDHVGLAALVAAYLSRPLADDAGALFSIEAHAHRDHLALTVVGPSERSAEALRLLARRLQDVDVKPSELEVARALAHERLKTRNDDRVALAISLAERDTLDPVSLRDPLGSAGGFEDRTLVDVRNFMDAAVAHAPIVLSIAGPVDVEATTTLAHRLLERRLLPSSRGPPPVYVQGRVAAQSRAPTRLRTTAGLTTVAWAYPLPLSEPPTPESLEVLALVLGGQVVHGPDRDHPGVLVLTADSSKVLRDRLQSAPLPFSDPELVEVAKARLVGREALALQTAAGLARFFDVQLAMADRRGFFQADGPTRRRAAVLSTTTADVTRAARAVFSTDPLIVIVGDDETRSER